MLREEIITNWQLLKDKITSYQPIKEIQSLLTELETLSQQVQNKKWKISQIVGHNKYLGELDYSEREKIDELNQAIDQLYQTKIFPLKEKLATLNPLWGKKEIENLTKQVEELRKQLLHAYQVEREEEIINDIERMNRLNIGYEERVSNAEQKYLALESKLDTVRELVSEGRLGKLKELIRLGQV